MDQNTHVNNTSNEQLKKTVVKKNSYMKYPLPHPMLPYSKTWQIAK